MMASANCLIKSGSEIGMDIRLCDSETDLSQYCRLCLCYWHLCELVSIFPSISTHSLKATIEHITGVKVNEGDGLLAFICNVCIINLKQIKEFSDISLASDKMLRKVPFQTVNGVGTESTQRLDHDRGLAIPCIYKQRLHLAYMSEFCRLCVSYLESGNMTPIFRGNEVDSLAAKITKVTHLEVVDGDGLPAGICDSCKTKLCQASEFIKKVTANDVYLCTELFQIKYEASELDDYSNTLVLYVKQEVKQEQDDNVTATETTLSLRSEGQFKSEPADDVDLNANAECDTRTNASQSLLSKSRGAATASVYRFPDGDRGNRLRDDLDSESEAKTFQCGDCLAKFPTRKTITKHLPCNVTTKREKRTSSIKDIKTKEHHALKKSRKMKTMQCNQCQLVFSSKTLLNVHTLADHETTVENTFQCDLCKKILKTKYSCVLHMRTHLEIKRSYQCDFCEKGFKTQSLCLTHMATHPGVKPSKCPLCDKGFRTLNDCKFQHFVHTTERPYKCEKCLKLFKTSSDVKKHMVWHSKEKHFACKICNRQFKTRCDVGRHQVVHSSARPHACNHCNKSFKTLPDLKQHTVAKTQACKLSMQCVRSGTRLEPFVPYSHAETRRRPALQVQRVQ